MLDRHPRTQKKRKKRIRRKISAASPDSVSRRPCSRRAESATFFTNASFFLAGPFGRRPSRMHGHENTERPVASRLDRIPGKKQRVMTVRRPLSSPEPSFLPSFHLVPSTPFPCTAIVSAPREPLAWGEGPEFRGGKKPFWASGEARGAIKRGRVGPEPGCSRVLTVVTRRLMRPTRGPRVGPACLAENR